MYYLNVCPNLKLRLGFGRSLFKSKCAMHQYKVLKVQIFASIFNTKLS